MLRRRFLLSVSMLAIASQANASTIITRGTLSAQAFGFARKPTVVATTNFVIVGQSDKISSSPDGITWTSRTSGLTSSDLNSVAFGAGVFVAISSDGKATLSSDGGATWTVQTSFATATGGAAMFGITFGLGLFVAVGTSGKIVTSSDGITWTSRTSSLGTTQLAVTFGLGASKFVAIDSSGQVQTSTNGTSWSSGTGLAFTTVFLFYSIVVNLFIASGYDLCMSSILFSSPDGVTWTPQTDATGNALGPSTDYNSTLYLSTIFGTIETSTNATSWSTAATNILGSNDPVLAMISSSTILVAAGPSGKLFSSTNGSSYTSRTSQFSSSNILSAAKG